MIPAPVDVTPERRSTEPQRRRGAVVLGSVLLVIASILAYRPVSHNGFTSYDDPDYVTENGYVKMGLTLEGFKWAFTNTQQSANWHPLTWLSHMLDAQLFGAMNAPAQHWMSVGIHIAAAIVLFLSLCRMTETPGCSLFVAALFAVHPLRVESVVWASERKDVLSALFWMLTLLAYWHYANRKSVGRYVLVVLALVLGLLAKPMLVTLPIILLLLDFWPLDRWRNEKPHKLIIEKLPLLGISVAAAIVTIVAQHSGQAVGDLSFYPLGLRIQNAILSYAMYLLKTIWPMHLSPFYPHPGMWTNPVIPAWQTITSAVVLVLITLVVTLRARRAPYLLAGWLWYGVTLVPVIGLVQVGKQAMADRYTYIPSIGLYIMIAWGFYHLVGRLAPRGTSPVERPDGMPARDQRPHGASPVAGWILVACAAIVVVLCVIRTHQQARYWKDDLTLWSRALQIDSQNFLALDMIGNYYLKQGDTDRAMAQYDAAQQARPNAVEHQHDMAGNVYAAKGDTDRALAEYERALKLQPNMPETHNNLGQIYSRRGDSERAIREFRAAIQYGPMLPQPYHNLALELARRGDLQQAMQYWHRALELKPDYAAAHEGLGHALRFIGDTKGAAEHYRAAIKLGSRKLEIMSALAWILATDPRDDVAAPAEALQLAEQCNRESHEEDGLTLDTLAAAQARNGKFAEAIATAQRAEKQARAAGREQLANGIQSRIMLYQKNQPYIEAPKQR
jgi:Flp pilus assembly protein TadD